MRNYLNNENLDPLLNDYDGYERRNRKKGHDVMQVCLNGHQITSSLRSNPEFGQKYCKHCGAETISTCKNCKTDIRGEYFTPGVISLQPTHIPEFCLGCGEPYPWKGKLLTKDSITIEANTAIKNLIYKIPAVIKQLRIRHNKRHTLNVRDEYDLQDLLHALLKLYFNDIRSEEYTPSYAGVTSKMDFLLINEKIVIETKMTRHTLRKKQLRQQIIEDKEYYKKHENCKILYFLVYDPKEYVENAQGFVNDLSEESDNFACKVCLVS